MRRIKEELREQRTRTSTREKINGIDTDALLATIDAIKADPSKASCKFCAATE
jgi:hypothetical protein